MEGVSGGDGRPLWRSPNVLALGAVSLLNDAASEMVVPLLPAFLGTLGAGALALGWIEGLADAAAGVLKVGSGLWADRTGRRRGLVLAGYALAAAARPAVALAQFPAHVLAARLTDRAGKGLRSAPRDAILAASVSAARRAAAFGLHRSMDHAGAVVGPLLALAWLTLGPGDLRTLFALSAVPGLLAVLAVLAWVREPAATAPPQTAPAAPGRTAGLWRLLVPLAIATLGQFSETFLLVAAGAQRAPLASLPLLWMAMHAVKALAALPGGLLADRWGRRRAVALGWSLQAVASALLALASDTAWVWVLAVAGGLPRGLTEGGEKALVAEAAPDRRWGAAFGVYHATLGLLVLAANVLFGALWESAGPAAAFGTASALALAGATTLLLVAPRAGPPARPAAD